jgi:hypothetical protein
MASDDPKDVLRQLFASGWYVEIEGKECHVWISKRPDY